VKTLHRYIFRAHVLNLIMTLVVFTFVLLLSNIFKDLVGLLANQTVSFWTICHFFILMLPYVLSFSMPMALLAATLLIVGRISADNELSASRACGISFFELMLPIFGTAAVLSIASFYVNSTLAPKTKYEFNKTFSDMILTNPISLLEEGQYIRNFPDLVLFIGKRDVKHNEIMNVRVTMMSNNEMTQEVYAEKGSVSVDLTQLKLRINLYNARINTRNPADPNNIQKRQYDVTVAEFPLERDLTSLIDPEKLKKHENHYTSSELWDQVLELKRQGLLATPKLVELHKRAALSMACVSFVLIGIPLGVQVQRRETSIGILISLSLAVVYYLLIIFAEGFKDRPHLFPEFIVWIPNLLFEFIGLFLIWKQSRI
jgi:lipopolysaccharide export system permease protein